MGHLYARNEKKYSAPLADGLRLNVCLRTWILRQTKFAAHADSARLLDAEMMRCRTVKATNWWASHFRTDCDCFGCKGGKETDLLAVFEGKAGFRFSLHFEIKHPGDQFKIAQRQPDAYKIRAACWIARAPSTVLPHQDAETILICSPSRLHNYNTHAARFDRAISIEQIAEAFPTVLPRGTG
jgi:hypothetical protein